jgi:hypothetical protein
LVLNLDFDLAVFVPWLRAGHASPADATVPAR